MATGTLTSTTIAARYKSLLKLTGTANDVLAADDSAKIVEDGDGNDSVLSLSTTRVGIGNTAPTALLTVGAITTLLTDGTTAVTPEGMNVHITEASKYAMGIKNADVSGDGLIIQAGDASDDYALRVENYDSGNDLFVITGGGFVGSGTASPSVQFHVTSSSADKPQVLIEHTGNDNSSGILNFENTRGTTNNGADGDELGKINFKGRNDRNGGADPEAIVYSYMQSKIVDASDGSEDGKIEFYTMKAGTSTATLTINSGKTEATSGIYEKDGVLKENLLPNSGFGVWSNGSTENVTDLVTNGAFSSDTSGWTAVNATLSSVTGGQSGNCLQISRTASQGRAYQSMTTVVGKLYKWTVYIKKGDAAVGEINIGTSDNNNSYYGSGNLTDGSFTAYSGVFEATTTSTFITVTAEAGTATMFYDTISLYEITPGCIGNDTLAPDGWQKRGDDVNIWRQHNHSTYTKGGSFYSLKVTSTQSAWNVAYVPAVNTDQLQKYSGRQVTFGAWVHSTLGTPEVRLSIYDNAGETNSSSPAQDTWTWLEVTKTITANPTAVQFEIDKSGSTSETYYVSQPMLVFGSSIGEGNYTRPVNEIVNCEKSIGVFDNATISSDADYNLETQSNGKIPKGTRALYMRGNQVPAAQGNYFGITCEGEWQYLTYHPTGNTTDWQSRVIVEQSGAAPQINVQRNATIGSVYMNATAVELF